MRSYNGLEFQFHVQLARCTKNELFVVLLSALFGAFNKSWSNIHCQPDTRKHGVDLHKGILAAIRSGDPRRARRATRDNLKAFLKASKELKQITRTVCTVRLGILVLSGLPIWGGQASHFEEILKTDSRSVSALTGLAEIRKSEGRYSAAVYYLRQAVAINPEDISLQFSLAAALSDNDNGEEAARILKRLIESRPKFAFARFNLGNVLCAPEAFPGSSR